MKQIQKEVDQWIQNYGVRYFNEMTNFTILTEEVGEMAFSNATTVNIDLHLPSTLKLEKIGKNAFWGFGKKVYLSDGTQVSTKWVN